jgi:phosphoribosyl-dephospho-CoA transferase
MFELGSAITIESEFKKHTPFGTDDYYDPTLPVAKITVTDPGGVKKVDAQNMVMSSVGKYYYVIQTATNWTAGVYQVLVTSGDGTNTDVALDTSAFALG